jgi:ornithine decarboxylase
LSPGAAWHGFTHLAPGHAITDPNKLTLLTPGFDRRTGAYADYGIPARWWRSSCARTGWSPRRTTSTRCSFFSHPESSRSKAGTLLSTLVAFKHLHDDNAKLDDVIGDFVRRRPGRLCRAAAA